MTNSHYTEKETRSYSMMLRDSGEHCERCHLSYNLNILELKKIAKKKRKRKAVNLISSSILKNKPCNDKVFLKLINMQ